MPNLHGPTFIRRKLLIHAVLSIIFYGVITWTSDCNLKKNRIEIRKTIRPLKLLLCSAYRTTSDFCLNIMSGIPSEEILIKEKISKYRKEDIDEINRNKLAEWYLEYERSPNTWIKRLIPELHIWLNRKYGNPDFYISQFLTGHGAFANYLFRFKKRDNPFCPLCSDINKSENDETIDTPEHTFFNCKGTKQHKEELERTLGKEVTPDNIMETMLESKRNWNEVYKYIRNTLITKQKYLQDKPLEDANSNLSSLEDTPSQGITEEIKEI